MKKNRQLNLTIFNLYGVVPVTEIARTVDLSLIKVYKILYDQGVTPPGFWSDNELKILTTKYDSISNEELRVLLLRSEDDIVLKAISLGLRKISFWTKKELEELKTMKAAGMTLTYMSDALQKTDKTIHLKLVELGLTRNVRFWTKKELALVEEMSHGYTFTYVDIANSTHASIAQVRSLCYYKKWNKEIKRTSSVGEEVLINLLTSMFPELQIWPQFNLGESLHLDVFIPALNIGFEYDGIQHFERIKMFQPKKNDFSHAKYLDERKDDLCSTLGIHLIRIPYTVELTKDYVLALIDTVGNGPGSIKLKRAVSFKGNITKSQEKHLGYVKSKLEFTKQARNKYLQSDYHKEQLKKAKQYRSEQYRRSRDLQRKRKADLEQDS